jgi:hypothetical protein
MSKMLAPEALRGCGGIMVCTLFFAFTNGNKAFVCSTKSHENRC